MLQGLITAFRGLDNRTQIGVWELNLLRAEITFFPGPAIGAHGKRIIPLRAFRRALHPLNRQHCAMTFAQLLFDGGPNVATSYHIRGRDGAWHLLTINGRITEYTHDGAALSITGICSYEVSCLMVNESKECA